MVFVRRRYYFWLIKAYIKRWNKTILTSLLLGGGIFFALATILNFYLKPLIEKKVVKIGYAGVYNINNLPEPILEDISYGLVSIANNGTIKPAAAASWKISGNGREYTFKLKRGQLFHTGQELTVDTLPYHFKDVSITKIDTYTILYKLKTPYSPFFVSVSKPILIENFSGLGKYKLKKIDLNGGFVKSLTIQSIQDASVKKNIYFYPTANALKLAFLLGDVDTINGVTNLQFKVATRALLLPLGTRNASFKQWKNVSIKKKTNYDELVTLFYNNANSILSEKKVRQALTYALPDTIQFGERAYSPIKPNSLYFSRSPNFGISDTEIAKSLLASSQATITKPLEISTTEDFRQVANLVGKYWGRLGIKTRVKIVSGIPPSYEVFLYQFRIPEDPDQYTLWHSQGVNNIVKYKSLRIDKLLEDGRQTTDIEKRQKIYEDFQKYLIDDAPASFFYYPYEYIISRI